MSLYEQITMAIESFTETCRALEKDGSRCDGVRGMIVGACHIRENLTIEAAECVVY